MFTSKRNDVEPMAALLSFDTTYKTYLWKVCVEARESTESNSTWKAEMPSSKHELRVCVYFFFLFIYFSVCLKFHASNDVAKNSRQLNVFNRVN